MSIVNNVSSSSKSSAEEDERATAGAVLGLRKKKRGDKIGTVDETFCTPAPPITHLLVEQWVQRALDAGVENLRQEFCLLRNYERPDMTTECFKTYHSSHYSESKNRYQDVPCQDQCIVQVISPPSPCDYVHAIYVGCPMDPEKNFICCQRPLSHTIPELWFMIIQRKYWPATQGEKLIVGFGISIENTSGTKPTEREPEIQITTLRISFNGTKTSVRHLHWTDWPDRGVPQCKLTCLELLSAVRGSKTPIVVHCSAGIGRTRKIVAIEYILG
ncbi:hypothetical protein CAEBREN_03280 [Caenorhabditis brenneri]|uniref:Tyrosine-protein phosphatase domain-containing protein n=1 Tax=Caenorhabditis brenneri TaxID=135651 RepID=G0MKQ7_CAEBE|nr:hypothetical protein CAEBREN_03280 [Caenorhabditis brenneri]